MALTMKERKSVTRETRAEYKRASKRDKKAILDNFIHLTDYNRSYAAYVLREEPKPVHKRSSGTHRKTKPKVYTSDIIAPLCKVWAVCGYCCGKCLAPFMPTIVPKLEKDGELVLSDLQRDKLTRISAATIDRLLIHEKKSLQIKGHSYTKPGSLLKHQIPVRTFADWDESSPGFIEIDLVAHDGGNSSGDFMQTLDATDIHTCWTETMAVKNKAQKWVFTAILHLQDRFPFPILGIDSDNGSEFINNILFRYCQKHEITFTRSRAGKKNDNCFVEQKNYSIVRKTVGYQRHDTPQELELLNEIYLSLRLLTNFSQPVRKLISKERIGSKVKKRYDEAATPFQRVLLSSDIHPLKKEELQRIWDTLNLAALRRDVNAMLKRLWQLSAHKTNPGKEVSAIHFE
ncbi:MAG: transposase family protein [bacterium]|nr:transposase family protein [bacterium]